MRKVHYKVVLEIFVFEDDDADGITSLRESDFWPENRGEKIDIHDVTVKSVKVIDSR